MGKLYGFGLAHIGNMKSYSANFNVTDQLLFSNQMFWNKPAPPHFHALYGEHEALIDKKNLKYYAAVYLVGRLIWFWIGRTASTRIIGGLGIMRTSATTETHQALGITPCAPWRVLNIKTESGYRLLKQAKLVHVINRCRHFILVDCIARFGFLSG